MVTPEEREFLVARRHVWVLRRTGRFPITLTDLKDELAKAGLDPARAVHKLRSAGLIEVDGSTAPQSESAIWCYANDVVPTGTVEFADALAVVDQRGKPVEVVDQRGEVLPAVDSRVKQDAVTLFGFDGRWFESRAYPLHPRSDHMTALRTALGREAASHTDGIIDCCAQDLRQALFDNPGALETVRSALASGRRVRIWLYAGGQLAELPWEVAGHPDSERMVIDDDRLALVRLVGSPQPSTVEAGWFHHPVVEYVCLSDDAGVDYWPTVDEVVRRIGWPEARRLDPEKFLATQDTPPERPSILHVVGHNDSTADLLVSGRHGNVGRETLIAAVLARSPVLVILGICFSGLEGVTVASAAREVCAGGVPTVVALRGEALVMQQKAFTRGFYDRLSLSLSPEDAMCAARQQVSSNIQRLQFMHFQHGVTIGL